MERDGTFAEFSQDELGVFCLGKEPYGLDTQVAGFQNLLLSGNTGLAVDFFGLPGDLSEELFMAVVITGQFKEDVQILQRNYWLHGLFPFTKKTHFISPFMS